MHKAGRAKASSAVFVLLLAMAMVNFLQFDPTDASTGVSTTAAYVQVRGVGNYGNWYPSDATPQQVVTMVQNFRAATGKPVSVLSIVYGPEAPGQLIGKTGYSVDQFLIDLKNAGGGAIIPTLNMNYYTSGMNITLQSYCDPHNALNCGPSWFWQVSSELLNLTAVNHGPRAVLLEAFAQWSRSQNASTIQSVLAGLKDQGWKDLITKQGAASGTPFPDFGYASYMEMTTQCQTVVPYCFENQGMIADEWSVDSHTLKGVIGMFDYQIIDTSSLAVFLGSLSARQQASALTSLAQTQLQGNYTYVYPLIVGTVYNGVTLYWDAATYSQPGGGSFLSLEESLERSYPVPVTTTSSSSSTTTSSSTKHSTSSSSTSVTSSSTRSSSTSVSSTSSPTTSIHSSQTSSASGEQTFSLVVQGGCSQSGGGTYAAGSEATATSQGTCNRGFGSGQRVSSWSLDGGVSHPVNTTSLVDVPILMNASHTLRFSLVDQYQLTLDYGAGLAMTFVTPPSISGDDFWYDSGQPVYYDGSSSAGSYVVVGWSWDDTPINTIGGNSSFQVGPEVMDAPHTLHLSLGTGSSCSGSQCDGTFGTVFLDTNSPSQVQFQVDGVPITQSAAFSWPLGSNHTIAAQYGIQSTLQRAVFTDWAGSVSSSSPEIHITVGNLTKLIAQYRTQYLVTFTFTDSTGNVLSPDGVVLTGHSQNILVGSNYTAWLDYGSRYMVTTATWNGVNVANATSSSSLRVLAPVQTTVPLMVFPQTVKVTDALGLPVGGAQVSITTANGTKVQGVAGGDGTITFEAPLGVYYLTTSFLGIPNTVWIGSVGSHELSTIVYLSYPILALACLSLVGLACLVVLRRRREVKSIYENLHFES
jgi:hypothetical protein